MSKSKDRNQLNELAIKQNLLLWELSKSFLDLDKKIADSIQSTSKLYLT